MGRDQRVATVHSDSSSDGDDGDPNPDTHLPFVEAFMERKQLKHVSSLQLTWCLNIKAGLGVYIGKTLLIPTDSVIVEVLFGFIFGFKPR